MFRNIYIYAINKINMPIAICNIKNKAIDREILEPLVSKWADKIGVNISDVSITFVPNCIQFGQQYDILCNLYLPSLWEKENVKLIQNELLVALVDAFKIQPEDIFIITNIVQSGNVMENGQIVEWT